MVVPATQAAHASAKARLGTSGANVTEAAHVSIESAQDMGDDLITDSAELGKLVYAYGADPANFGIFVAVTGDPSASARDFIAEFAEHRQVPIRVEVDPGTERGGTTDNRRTDPSSYAGGARCFMSYGSGSSDPILDD